MMQIARRYILIMNRNTFLSTEKMYAVGQNGSIYVTNTTLHTTHVWWLGDIMYAKRRDIR